MTAAAAPAASPAATRARGGVLGGGAATLAIAGLTWKRLLRGRAIWLTAGLAAVPAMLAVLLVGRRNAGGILDVLELSILILAILVPFHVAASLGEELEERTAAYLWSRPVPRWTILTGKLVVLVPVIVALQLGFTVVAAQRIGALGTTLALDRIALGFGLGVAATSCCAAAIATLWPRHGMAAALVYLLFFDLPFGAIPTALQNLTASYHVRAIFSAPVGAFPIVALAVIAAAWLAIALVRIRRLE